MEKHLLSSIECLERIVNADDVLLSAAEALSAALAASVVEPNLRRSFPTIVIRLSGAIERAAPNLARCIANEIPANDVEVGLQAFRELLSDVAGLDRERRQLHVGLLSAQLNALHCCRELENWGGPLSPASKLCTENSISVH